MLIKKVFAGVVLLTTISACGGEDTPAKKSFVSSCSAAIQSLDCGCFYDAVHEAMSGENEAKIVAFLRDKRGLSAKQQKAKLEQIVGKTNVTTFWRASVNCPK